MKTNSRLIITVSSRVLFDLEEENRFFQTHSLEEYRRYQRTHENRLLRPGTAYGLVRKLLELGSKSGKRPIEVILVSNNDADTGIRIFKSIKHLGLPIFRAAFTNGAPKYPYLAAFDSALYLGASKEDVQTTIRHGYAAAHILAQPIENTDDVEAELRVAFDFDCVLADGAAQTVFDREGLNAFRTYEERRSKTPHKNGPIYRFLQGLVRIKQSLDPAGQGKSGARIRTAIITARDAAASERVIRTLRRDGLVIDETFFLGGLKKDSFVEAFKADIFFDDQIKNLSPGSRRAIAAWVPF